MNDGAIILTESEQSLFDTFAKQYSEASDEFAAAEAKKNALNKTIKSMLSEYNMNKYVSKESGITLSVSTRPNVSYDENVLLCIIKNLGVDGIIKTKEYVDMEALESALYHGTIKKEDIKDGIIVKPDIVTLRCTKKQKLNE